MNDQFLKRLALFFLAAAAICAVCSIFALVLTPVDIVMSDGTTPNRWVIWAGIPATYLTILFGWIASKLVDCK